MDANARDANARRARRRAFAGAALRLIALFAVVFYATDRLAAWREPLRLQAAFERAIPYWPAAFAVYASAPLAPLAVGWLAPDARWIRHWARAMALAIVVAGAVFALLPTAPAWPDAPTAAADGRWHALARAARAVAARHNMLPSLHVALCLVSVLWAWPHARGAARRATLAAWMLALAASTLLTHQHHLADVVAGALLGAALGPRRGVARLPAPPRPGHSPRARRT